MAPYQKWPIYATKRMVEIIPNLCMEGKRHTVVANVMFHCLGSGILDKEYNTVFRNEYMETLNHLFNNRMKEENGVNSHEGVKELVFSPFNQRLVNEVSPSIYATQRDHLISSLEESLKNFSMYYTDVKENIDLNRMYHSVGVDFVKLIKLLRLEHKLEELSADVINDFFKESIGSREFHKVMEFLQMLMAKKELDMFTPFVKGSVRLVEVLVGVVETESRTVLEQFYRQIPKELHTQCLKFLRSTDPNTGLLIYDWGYSESELILSGNLENVSGQPQRACSRADEETRNNTVLDRVLVNNIASLYSALQTLKTLSKQGVRGSNKNFQNELRSSISVHFEPDIVVISTHRDVFVIDTLIRDSLYKASLYKLLDFVWSSELTKIGHNIMLNMAKLSCQFEEPFRKYNKIVDLNDKRVKKIKVHNEDGAYETSQFRSTGITRNLNGLLQEYNVGVPPRKKWNGMRPIPVERVKYLSIVARGMLSIEYQLRSQGWMPSSICASSSEEKTKIEVYPFDSKRNKGVKDLGSEKNSDPDSVEISEKTEDFL
ncbi:conserved hypothetical protein [Theileria orientalis strain Shintoku]|uniref:3'-5' exonuclease domain-containing protein n=1 Tax=Theileria orientalis strain Shintoku TaxID=869250 RepID=J4D5Z4_THEOR|nr:conserved hypothetical protein [Theileria orientalis strain Shintoku]BAM39260.1 conserved hypothetical protein [Theileria orientalis strain Shintoku]|eukprot:XP_009689561.1 conserved hypothetical protein [Theileria orientalis strain Shintoku]